MTDSLCHRLDDYLAGDLDAAHQCAFEEHVGHCTECAEELRLQATIDRLLAAARPSPPPELQRNVSASIRRRRTRSVARLAIAASLLLGCVAGWRFWIARGDSSPELQPMADVNASAGPENTASQRDNSRAAYAHFESAAQPPEDGPLAGPVTVDAGRTAIVVSEPSGDPTVHIFWLYPTKDISITAPQDSTEPERKPL